MSTHFQHLYTRLKSILRHCDAFATTDSLEAIFTDPRIREWRRQLPTTYNREQRIEQTLVYLYAHYNVDRENALVLFLDVLSDKVTIDDGLRSILDEMGRKVARTLSENSLDVFRMALKDDGPFYAPTAPFVGQVIAGTGCVEMASYVDTLAPGEMVRLEVIGNSMEYEGIFQGDQVIVRVFNTHEWPSEGDMIVTKYLPFDTEPEMPTDLIATELAGPTLKVFHQRVNGEFHLGWRKDNVSWRPASWKRMSAPGNTQMIITRYIDPIGKVIDVRRQRRWKLPPFGGQLVLGGDR